MRIKTHQLTKFNHIWYSSIALAGLVNHLIKSIVNPQQKWHFDCTRHNVNTELQIIFFQTRINEPAVTRKKHTKLWVIAIYKEIQSCEKYSWHFFQKKNWQKMVNTMDKIVLTVGIWCCIMSLATCQVTSQANNSSDLSEGLCSKNFELKIYEKSTSRKKCFCRRICSIVSNKKKH